MAKSAKLITNKAPSGYGETPKQQHVAKFRWTARKNEIQREMRTLHPSSWSFFVRHREQGYKDGKCVQEAWEDAYEATVEWVASGMAAVNEVPHFGN